jgi:hypothetical protein
MSVSQRYKSRIIDPRAFGLADGSGWTAEVYVADEFDDETIDGQFMLKEIFPAKEAALSAALVAGKREVDKRDISSVLEQHTQLPSTHGHGLVDSFSEPLCLAHQFCAGFFIEKFHDGTTHHIAIISQQHFD